MDTFFELFKYFAIGYGVNFIISCLACIITYVMRYATYRHHKFSQTYSHDKSKIYARAIYREVYDNGFVTALLFVGIRSLTLLLGGK